MNYPTAVQAYSYDPVTGVFADAVTAYLDPLESDAQGKAIYGMPANSTLVAPPTLAANEAAVFVGGTWSIQSDFRGTAYWLSDGTAHIQADIGALPDGALLTQPPGQVKAKMWVAIKAERDRRTENGGYAVDGVWFHSDQKSRSQQQDNEAEGSALLPVEWKTMDGSFVTMTADLAAQVRAARMASDRTIFAVAEAHRTAMESSANPATYDYSGGWPKTHDEVTAP